MRTLLLSFLIGLLTLPSIAQNATPANPDLVRIDRNHSTLGFIVPIVEGLSKVTGKFTDFSVDLIWKADNLDASSVRLVIQVESVDTGIDARNEHLKSADFFDVAVHPTITFTSSKIRKNGDSYLVDGTFVMHGVSRDISLPLVVNTFTEADKTWTAFRVATTLDRTDFGMNWKHSIADFFVGNEIEADIVLLTR